MSDFDSDGEVYERWYTRRFSSYTIYMQECVYNNQDDKLISTRSDIICRVATSNITQETVIARATKAVQECKPMVIKEENSYIVIRYYYKLNGQYYHAPSRMTRHFKLFQSEE